MSLLPHYNDAWVAERTVAVERMTTREKAHPVIAQIIAQADKFRQQMRFKPNITAPFWLEKLIWLYNLLMP